MAKPDNTQKRKEREAREQAEDGLKFVIDGAKIKCDLCTVPVGDLKVNYDTPSTQDKRTATVVEKDKKSLIFKGNCKKSPQSSSPCASVMKLADWKDVGTVYFQDEFPLLLKSTIKCNYGGVDIKITDCGQRNEITNLDTTGAPVPSYAPVDFDIDFKFNKNEKTVVPFGILDFNNKNENPFFSFKYTLKGNNVDSLSFKITDENNEIIYQMGYLKPVIIVAHKKPKILFKATKPTEGPLITKTWDYKKLFEPYILEEPDYTKIGSYHLNWDGFDNKEVYDSTRFAGKKLKAQITAVKGGKVKTKEIEFELSYNEVKWVDVKIDRNSKRIDVTLRVNLTDGGEKGLDCSTYTIETEASYETFTPTTGVDPLAGKKITTCDWDKVPASVINPSRPVIKSRTKTFDELKKMAFAGLEKYWGRNKNNIIGKNVNIVEAYEVYIKAVDTSKNALHSLPLVYNTNGDWMRSGNPGGSYSDGNLDDNFLNALPDLGVIQRLSYNVGYIYEYHYLKTWEYQDSSVEDEEFKETAAHEIGHELLQAYGGTVYSWQHKGSSYYLPQDTKPTKGNETQWDKISHLDEMKTYGEDYPTSGEIDIMKYYNKEPRIKDRKRKVASEKDILGLLWLTKLQIK